MSDYYVTMRVEIPFGSNIKYEFKEDGKLWCDRVLHSPMSYPFNYGYIPETLAGDGDALDCVLLTDTSFHPGTYITCKIVGVLMTVDEKGPDEKVLLVPAGTVDPSFNDINNLKDLNKDVLEKIKFFFRYYKTLEKDKWVEIGDFLNRNEAMRIYNESMANFIRRVKDDGKGEYRPLMDDTVTTGSYEYESEPSEGAVTEHN